MQALEQQTATAEILRVISASPSDLQPVFNAIARSAQKLFGARAALVCRRVDDVLHLAAHTATTVLGDAALRKLYPAKLTGEGAVGKAVLSGKPACIIDVQTDPAYSAQFREGARKRGYRSLLAVPMLREGFAIGAIYVTRRNPGPFSEQQVNLLQTFAAQAVMAIENVRLFNDTKEALERQTATSEILKVISSSPTDVRPVFDAIVVAAQRLIGGKRAGLLLRGETNFEVVASSQEGVIEHLPDELRIVPLDRAGNFPSRAILDGEVVHVPDWEANEVPEFEKLVARTYGIRSGVIVPLLRQGQGIGALAVTRAASGAYHEKEIELLRSFADQAVIAIENARLFNETKESLEQQTATARILGVMSSSPTDVQPVLDAVAESAARLCETDDAIIRRVEPGGLRRVAHFGPLPASEKTEVHPGVAGSVGGRAVLECRAVYVEDTEVEFRDESYAEARALWALGGKYRTMLAMPLVREGAAIGVILCRRREKRPFTYRQIALLKTFADQAVIAIENVRLFNETKEALERQTATADILKVISASPTDVQPVFEAVAQRAAQLCNAANASVWIAEGTVLRRVAAFGHSMLLTERPARRTWINGRTFLDLCTVHVEDVVEMLDEYPETREDQQKLGVRTMIAVPMMREGKAVGTIGVWRREVKPFSKTEIELLETFAAQAVIAIENTRLFNETKEALERQTATSEILKVISRTTFDLQPVLEIVLSNARKLCEADSGIIFRPDDEGNYRPVAFAAPIHERTRRTRDLFERAPIRVDRSSATGRAIVEGVTVHVPDVTTDPEYRRLDIATVGDYRSILAVPMLRAGMPIGVLTLSRVGEAKPFSDKQIELVTVFADQAVIAIENVRLFREIQEKSAQLEVANKHKSDFLANMSHELRTPLNAIIGFSEAMMDKLFGELNEKQSEYLKDIHESGKHLLSLINDILDLSKIEAGRMELELSNFHLPTAVSNAVILVRERAMRHGIALGMDIDQRLGEFQADERKVKQILLNLLSNAVKFTPDGGRVDVSAKLDTDKVEISVKDTGVGIAPEDQASLFEEFKQLGRDSSRKAEGTGLGLALTKRLVELHGGQISVDSVMGHGSTFRVMLPLAHHPATE